MLRSRRRDNIEYNDIEDKQRQGRVRKTPHFLGFQGLSVLPFLLDERLRGDRFHFTKI